MIDTSGPDIADIQCRVPDGCCGASPCDITLDDFICQIRSLLPEGQIYNNTALAALPDAERPEQALAAHAIGCNRIGNEQLIYGGCCGDKIPCADNPVLPQLAVVDAFAAVGFGSIEALCIALRELDPCTAQLTIRDWAARMGITYPDECEGEWSEDVLKLLICVLWQVRREVVNWDFLVRTAALFGACITMRYAGQFDCPEEHPSGWWTMAREMQPCPPIESCPPAATSHGQLMPLLPTCYGERQSLNLILCPCERLFPQDCNLPTVPSPQPHDPEFYAAFKWLLPQILPPTAYWCTYACAPAECIQ